MTPHSSLIDFRSNELKKSTFNLKDTIVIPESLCILIAIYCKSMANQGAEI